MNDQGRRERQFSPAPAMDQSEVTVAIVCLGVTYLCTKQLQLISSHRTKKDKAEGTLRAESRAVEEVGPRKPEKLV